MGRQAEQRGKETDRPVNRDLRHLRALLRFVAPYKIQVMGAVIALVVAAGTVLTLGQGVQALVDEGFSGGDADLLDRGGAGSFCCCGCFGLCQLFALFSCVLGGGTGCC